MDLSRRLWHGEETYRSQIWGDESQLQRTRVHFWQNARSVSEHLHRLIKLSWAAVNIAGNWFARNLAREIATLPWKNSTKKIKILKGTNEKTTKFSECTRVSSFTYSPFLRYDIITDLVLFPLQWMEKFWKSHSCYKELGVDGSLCSFLIYLSEVSSWDELVLTVLSLLWIKKMLYYDMIVFRFLCTLFKWSSDWCASLILICTSPKLTQVFPLARWNLSVRNSPQESWLLLALQRPRCK